MNELVIAPSILSLDFSKASEQMQQLAEFFGVNYRKDFLNL